MSYETDSDSMHSGEQVRWARLNTFLVWASILFVGWCTVYVAGKTDWPARTIMVVVSVLGVLSGVFWCSLLYRSNKWHKYFLVLVLHREQSFAPTDRSHTNGQATFSRGFMMKVSSSTRLLVAIPAVVAALYVGLLVLAITL